jgi:hypothetical protein
MHLIRYLQKDASLRENFKRQNVAVLCFRPRKESNIVGDIDSRLSFPHQGGAVYRFSNTSSAAMAVWFIRDGFTRNGSGKYRRVLSLSVYQFTHM